MKLNMSKIVFMKAIILSCLVSLSTNNWMTIWIMMETSLFMFIPLMSKNKVNDQSMKYFIIQSTSSYILVFSFMINSFKLNSLNNVLTMVSLMMKIGMPPFHIWKPEIMKMLNWNECMVLTTAIKIPPLVLLNKVINLNLLLTPLVMSLLVGSMSGMNQLNLKKMMAYSSIFNVSWMSASFMISKKSMIMFMTVYTLLNIKVMYLFKNNNLIFLNQMTHTPLKVKLLLNLTLLSISGLPPLTGFYPKWIILSELVSSSVMLTMTMIMTSILSIFMYIQMNTFTMSNLLTKKKNNKFFLTKNFSILNFLILPIMFMVWTS